LEDHFKNKGFAKEIFEALVREITQGIGEVKVVSIPCCIHLFGRYDFLAALPKRDGLEIRFALDRVLKTPRLKQSAPVTKKEFKNCIDIYSIDEIDSELLSWIKEAYYLRNLKEEKK
jgi:hypothetical protein